jgi:prepilin-type N-terminal cleavage/methylation domain-containing protein
MHFSSKRGMTLTEIIVVIAVMSILLAMTVTAFDKLGAMRALDTDTQAIVLELQKARSLTLASKNEKQYGLHFASSSVTLFEGSTYIAGSASSTITYLNPFVSITSLSLTAGASDIVFDRLTGKTSQSGTIVVTLAGKLSATKTIAVYGTGVAEIQ